MKRWWCWGRESAAGSCCWLAAHGKTPWCPALWVEPGSVQVVVVGAAELGARGRQCPGLMCRGVVFVKTGPLMTLSPSPAVGLSLPPSLQQHWSIWKPFARSPQRKFRPDHPQHLLSVYLPTALNPLDKLKEGNCRATDHIGSLRTEASAAFPSYTLLMCMHLKYTEIYWCNMMWHSNSHSQHNSCLIVAVIRGLVTCHQNPQSTCMF